MAGVYTRTVTLQTLPIGPYVRQPASIEPWDPRGVIVAETVTALVAEGWPGLVVEHIGSTSVPGLPGKGIVDLVIAALPDDIPGITTMLYGLGFGPQPGEDPFPPTRPLLVGSMTVDGAMFRIHCHVQPRGEELIRDLAFRDALRADATLAFEYARLKTEIVEGGHRSGFSTRTVSRRGSPRFIVGPVFADARSSRPPSSASLVVASSAGCSPRRLVRWAIAWPCWTRIRSVRRPRSPTR